jgi:RNA polymerase sigma factor (sigma-70 family)
MDTSRNDCKKYENCEDVAVALARGNELLAERVFSCLFSLYKADCTGWLVRIYGRKPPGQADEHNASHAFGDALRVLNAYIKAGRFFQERKPNACRRFIYSISRRTFWKLQSAGLNGKVVLTDTSVEDILKNPEPFFVYPLEKEENEEKVSDLHRVINSMDMPCRQLLKLKYIDLLTSDEIMEQTGLSDKKLYKQLFVCREKLKKILKGAK